MLRDRPACVVGFGGYPALPAMTASYVLRLPRMIHEQNGVLGRVNEAFVRRVSAIACGTWPTKLPPGTTAFHTGNPVRRAILDKAGSPYITPGDWPMDVLVFGGSQGASIMNHVPLALEHPGPGAARPPDHRPPGRGTRMRNWSGRPMTNCGVRAVVKPFFDDIPERMSKAQLVICRAGASSIADLTVIGRPAILIPLAASIRKEQHANAAGMQQAGAAFVIEESALTAERLAGHIAAIVGEPEGANAAAAAALSVGKPERGGDAGRPCGEDRVRGQIDEPTHRHADRAWADPFRGHRRDRDERHRRGSAEPRLHGSGLGPEGKARSQGGWPRRGHRFSSDRRPRT